ncbi:hypothetical protein GCM10007383_38900 [Arenibacter certesii]|uniref:Right handed beta helix domain-containing protein n=2 Tax=Arenibacter certesii TaxID=228955 RepID=A0A918MRV0_9FLAO|nr:hypothetical protein GCM10007383_38900 [Arenibacter certesii]
MFDLSKIDGQITSANLEFTISSDPGHGTIEVYLGKGTNWTETNLTGSNKPSSDSFLGSIKKSYPLGSKEKISLNAESFNAEKTSLILLHKNGNDLAFASKSTSSSPKLTVTYSSSSTSSPSLDPEASKPIAPVAKGYFVTVNGRATNNGLSESSAWNLEHAFKVAKAGDVFYIKAGNYGNPKLVLYKGGTAGNPIKFIGYNRTPGDIVSHNGSTFKYRDQVDSNKMPLLTASRAATGTAIIQYADYVEFENLQITGYKTGIQSDGNHVVLRNIVATNLGTQNYNTYSGFGLMVTGNNTLVENCYILNAGAEAIKLFGANNSRVNNCSVYSDNSKNPTDYYFLIAGGTNNAIIENSVANRAAGLSHGGHGFTIKDLAERNTIRNCTAYKTNFELNFSGVRFNTIKDSFIYGASTNGNDWHANLSIFNGANNNLIKNLYIQDTWAAINWAEYNDGYVGPGGDRDQVSCGYDNTFDGITVKNTNRILNVGGGTNYTAAAKRNTFINSDFSNFRSLAVTYYPTENIKFTNSKFSNGQYFVTEAGGAYARYSKFNVTYQNCTWVNNNFRAPN